MKSLSLNQWKDCIVDENNKIVAERPSSYTAHSTTWPEGEEIISTFNHNKGVVKIAVQNIMLLIELETIAEDPTSDKAKEIISKYREKIDRRKEIDMAESN